MILSGQELVDRLRKDNIVSPLTKTDDELRKSWQVDLYLGDEAFTTSCDSPVYLSRKDYLILHPGEYVIVQTEETIAMPLDLMGFISIRFKHKKQGLVNISGFHVDPGWEGPVTFSMFHAGTTDICLDRRDPVFMIFLCRLTEDLSDCTPKRGLNHLPGDLFPYVKGTGGNMVSITQRMHRMETSFRVFTWVTTALLAPLVLALVAYVIRLMFV